MIKKILSAFLAVMMLCTCTGCNTSLFKKDKPITASEAASRMGMGLNLGNTMEAYEATDCEKATYEWIPVVGENRPVDYETCWGAVETTQEVINGIKAEGFDTVRIPVFWGNMMANDGTYTIDPEYIGRVREIVDYCCNAGLYAVINIHHFDEFIIRRNSTEKCSEIFTRLWTQIAEYFKDYPYTVMFEGYNEYLGGDRFDESGELSGLSAQEGYHMTNTLNQTFVDAVRATGGKNAERVLIVSGYFTNIDRTTSPEFIMPTDTTPDRLMVSVHYVDNSMYWQKKIGGGEWISYVDNQIEKLKAAFSEKNIPVFVGETSVNYPKANFDRSAMYTTSSECVDYILRKLLINGFVPVIWDVNDNFYSRTKYRIKAGTDRKVIRQIASELHGVAAEDSEIDYSDIGDDPAPLLDMGTRTTMEYVRDMGVGINLGNTFDCMGDWYSAGGTPSDVERAWGSPIITREAIQGYADAGFGVMRLPVSWASLMDADGNIDPAFLDRIDEVVGWILDSGMYCILNSHHDGWTEKFPEDYDKAMRVYENVWTQICSRFDKYGEKLMFESMNEVGFDGLWNQYGGTDGKEEAYAIFNAINQKFVDVVRSTGVNNARRHLLIASYWTSIERACDPLFVMPDDPENRMAVSVHYYGPSTLTLITHDVEWGKARTDWGSEEDYKELNMWMDMMEDSFISKGIPVIVGEFGCFGGNKTRETRELWMMDVANAAYSRKMCPVLWDTSGGEYSRTTCYFKYPEFIASLVGIADEK
ncbi:MAG: glycoside hydrolase family 5 protein [Oscillospiraceae bacterium]